MIPSLIHPISFQGDTLVILDQTRLPKEVLYLTLRTPEETARAIGELRVRGAPLIGITAGYGILLLKKDVKDPEKWEKSMRVLRESRPTAVNLFYVLDQLQRIWEKEYPSPDLLRKLKEKVDELYEREEKASYAMASLGAQIFPGNSLTLLTHCNTGSLATPGIGTALGVIRKIFYEGRLKEVFVTETRPLMQGVRLTAWELLQEGIPFRVLPDSAVGHLFSRIPISGVVVGADRIARNGDTANKVGTKVLATLAHLYKIPFVVVAPTSTIDLSTPTGEEIPVEYRSDEELRTVLGVRLYGEELKGFNPAFDITPHTYISAIVTEKGIAYPPFSTTLPTLLNS